ncbi:MAG TPA: hypothetical protein DEH11_18405 [Actinobacteria bacterium]|nr:hypothetical protein [Actinomycetota bacterium]
MSRLSRLIEQAAAAQPARQQAPPSSPSWNQSVSRLPIRQAAAISRIPPRVVARARPGRLAEPGRRSAGGLAARPVTADGPVTAEGPVTAGGPVTADGASE